MFCCLQKALSSIPTTAWPSCTNNDMWKAPSAGQWERYVMSDESLQGHFAWNGALYFLCPSADTPLITLIESVTYSYRQTHTLAFLEDCERCRDKDKQVHTVWSVMSVSFHVRVMLTPVLWWHIETKWHSDVPRHAASHVIEPFSSLWDIISACTIIHFSPGSETHSNSQNLNIWPLLFWLSFTIIMFFTVLYKWPAYLNVSAHCNDQGASPF